MSEEQKLLVITPAELLERVTKMKQEGFRLVQIGCTKLAEGLEVNYSFDKDHGFVNLKVCLPLVNDGLPSVSGIFWNAFLYENETHDLFGLKITGMALDYQGHFYRLAQKAPFNQAAKTQPAPAAKKDQPPAA
jgi:ech hydrogenase subunit D